MSWGHQIILTEYIFIGAFILFYALYIIRMIRIGKALGTSYQSVFVKLFLRTLIFILLITALLGPMFGSSQQEVKSVGKDIMVCLDISRSMNTSDIAPTRLEKMKFELKRIVSAFNSDRIGIIIFSSEAFMQCPLTYDQNALNLFIETLNTDLVPSGGTDFGPPLTMALKKLENDDSPLQSKSKIIILISDGEDFGDDTGDAATEIDKRSIKLFALGIGTEKGGTIRTGSGVKMDRSGVPVVSKLNSESLQKIATKTGGQYFEINETRNDVSRLIDTIDKVEGELRDSRMVDISANKYYYFLGLAVILLLLDILINVKTVTI